MINIEDFGKVEIKIGKIISAEKIQNADKLLKLMVDFGEKEKIEPATPAVPVSAENSDKVPASADADTVASVEPERDIRQIVSGIALHFPEPEKLVGKMCPFVTNLEPRKLRGFESNGMIMASSGPERFSLLEATGGVCPGDTVK